MTKRNILALVISRGGTVQNGLLALMTTIPRVSSVLVAQDIEAGLKMAENHQPALIIMDMYYPKNRDDISKIKKLFSHIHIMILVENIRQQKEAEESGADSVLIKGFQPQKLINIVEGIIA